MFGFSAPWMHLRGLLWHLLAVAAAWRLARGLLAPWPAAVAALIFGLHPVQAEAVTWIAARNDPMAAAIGGWALVAAAQAGPRSRAAAALLSGMALRYLGLYLSCPHVQGWQAYSARGFCFLHQLPHGKQASSPPSASSSRRWRCYERDGHDVVVRRQLRVLWPCL